MLMTLGSVSVIRSQVPAKTKVQGSYCGQCRSASAAPLYSAGAGTVQSQALRIATHNLASKSPNSQLLSTLTAPSMAEKYFDICKTPSDDGARPLLSRVSTVVARCCGPKQVIAPCPATAQ